LNPAGDFKPLPPELANLSIVVSHAQVTWLRIRTAEREHETSLDYSRLREPVDRIKSLERKLRSVADAIKAGEKPTVR
jgi:hypothetical protein